MSQARCRLLFSLTLFLFTLSCLAQEPKPLRGRLSLPAKSWGVVLDLPGFTVKSVETKPDGRRYMVATSDSTNVTVSLTLEAVNPAQPSGSCRKSLEAKTKHSPLKIKDVRYSQSGNLEIMRYMVPEFNGQAVNQESLFGCQFYDFAYIDLHISKPNYVAGDEPSFTSVLNSIHIDKLQRSSKELMEQASRLYLEHDYKGAIDPYSQALELEKAKPELEKTLWYMLVDNLGMSYGITGNLQKAKETFEYGVSKDPQYPLFYYNLACTYAEMGNITQAGDFLKKAFANKANILPGETMPDPRKDDSFKHATKDRDFRGLVESLMTSQ